MLCLILAAGAICKLPQQMRIEANRRLLGEKLAAGILQIGTPMKTRSRREVIEDIQYAVWLANAVHSLPPGACLPGFAR
jgi:hypothetical protein